MDELQIKGKKYISSKRASEISGYAKDYVGQLARQGKIPATRVGRAWYIDELAILNHSRGNLDEEEKENQVNIQNQYSRIRPLHSLKEGTSPSFNTWSSIKYINDDGDLVPSPINQDTKPEVHEVKITKSSEIMPRKEVSHKMDGIKARVEKPEEEVIVQEKVKEKEKGVIETLLLAGGASVVFVAVIALGGIYMASTWAFNGGSMNYLTASVAGVDLGFMQSFFLIIFDGGISLISDFLSSLLNSLGLFFNIGLQFIQNLFINILG